MHPFLQRSFQQVLAKIVLDVIRRIIIIVVLGIYLCTSSGWITPGLLLDSVRAWNVIAPALSVDP